MLINELFYKQPYQKEFDAIVRTCFPYKDGYLVTLDRTLFYPEGGGEPADTGTINGISVLDVQEHDGVIVHYLETALPEGSEIHGQIDWERRFHMMQCHTAEHIISGLIHQKFGYENVGFHMSDVITLDLNGPISWDELKEIEARANQIVYENVPVLVLLPNIHELSTMEYRSKKELTGPVRIIKIPGADSCACCGMHVSKTGEIGTIKLLSLMNHRGGVRISMTAGYHAMLDYQNKHDQCTEISQMLSLKPSEIVEGVQKLKNDLLDKDHRIIALNHQIFELKTASYAAGQPYILEVDADWNSVEIRQFCEMLRKADKAKINVVLSGSDTNGYYYCVSSNSINLRNQAKALNTALKGRGGGSPQMIQGSFRASLPEILAYIKQLAEESL